MKEYNPQQIEPRWQQFWEENRAFQGETDSKSPKKYCLDMFAYPSGDGLHVGHPRSYTATDIFARYYRMKGFNVMRPIGWDAFGLPAENYAIKVGKHPQETTEANIATFTKQIKSFGFAYDWSRELKTSDPNYYKWTQWIFKVLYDNGYAYQKEAYANWCPSCQTVLANEQVVDGKCERCGTPVEQKKLKQWFFKITDFAEELLAGLDDLDWPESTKTLQRNWIGRSEGAELIFKVKDSQAEIKVFTTRADTLFGATYIVLAPEHELVVELTTPEQKVEVEKYVAETKLKTNLDRTVAKEKTGVFTGSYAINPATGKEIPVWIADYVLTDYGTGAIMAVPAHDERDFEFAKKYKLPRVCVIKPSSKQIAPFVYPKFCSAGGETYEEAIAVSGLKEETIYQKILEGEYCYLGPGKLINSGEFDGQEAKTAGKAIAEKFGGKLTIQYKLHDWLISRQRYWGAPIPIVYSADGIAQSVGDADLPVILPDDVDFRPTGESPLAQSHRFQEGVEAKYGPGAKRELDTMDTFVCSSWYFLRYCDPHNNKEFADKKSLQYWMPVDIYIGGAEHATGHLLYSRFITKVLQKLGYLKFGEPFLKLRHQGLVLGSNGEKMSKSRGNVVNPDELVAKFGADTIRTYEMFMGPFDQMIPWDTNGVMGVRRFLDRVWRLVNDSAKKPMTPDIEISLHKTIKKVTEDIEEMKFNTAISAMMEFINEVSKAGVTGWEESFVKLLSPFAPHMAEELWQGFGNQTTIISAEWPSFDEKKLVVSRVEIVVQEKGKVRGTVTIAVGASEDEVVEAMKQNEKFVSLLAGATKRIYVQDKIINLV